MEREAKAPGASGVGRDGGEKPFNIISPNYDSVKTQISD
jgi:hypothetical protein